MADPIKKRKRKHRPPALSAAEVRFCSIFVRQRKKNATQAYLDADVREDVTREQAGKCAHWLLKRHEIWACINQMLEHAMKAEQVTVDRLAASLADEAFADRTGIYDRKGRIRPPAKWPAELRALLVGMESVEHFRLDGTVSAVTYKPKFVRPTEAKRILAQWRRMIGQDAQANAGAAPAPLVVGGEADPGAL